MGYIELSVTSHKGESMNEVLKASLPSLLAVSVPSLMVLVGILLNQRAVDGVRADLRDLKSEMNAMRTTFHSDIVMLVQRDGDKDTRIAILEERSQTPPASR